MQVRFERATDVCNKIVFDGKYNCKCICEQWLKHCDKLYKVIEGVAKKGKAEGNYLW